MASCPFWSSRGNLFSCYKECPMNKENTKEECIFSIHLSSLHNERVISSKLEEDSEDTVFADEHILDDYKYICNY